MSVRAFVGACLVALVAPFAVSGCAVTPTTRSPDVVFNHIRDRNAKVSAAYPTSRLEGWLPNRQYAAKDGAKPLSAGVVVGSVVDAVPGRAFSANGDGRGVRAE